MVSEVKGPGSGLMSALERASARPESAGTPGARPAAGSADVVQLTELSARLQAVTSRMDQLAPVDRERVAELRQDIADGNYQVDSNAIAEKLSEFEALLANLS
ncbi:MAG: flagellar biosynthesis anti-sigma factor FlgM [Gammaproteobacteria bacterium]|nr:flagellar biosynthesis anti-sigma factor FlgM [Gammaproteobacteria bacterium]NNM00023.1 flagellar biosynthesis anti-sigma factor FlgM [Gammaproteobacteria bacterium]